MDAGLEQGTKNRWGLEGRLSSVDNPKGPRTQIIGFEGPNTTTITFMVFGP